MDDGAAPRRERLTPAAADALDLVAAAGRQPVALTGEQGLVSGLVVGVLERGLEVELAAHLGHDRWATNARGAENIRNGAYSKRLITDLGAIRIQMPRDRRGTFEPVIVPKHGRRLIAPAASIAAVYASGMTRAEMRSQLDSVTGSRLDRDLLELFIDELEPGVHNWRRRRFHDPVPVLLIDSITLPGKSARASRRSLDVAVAIDAYGDAELLGLWRSPRTPRSASAGASAQVSPRWSPMLEELLYRGIATVELIGAVNADDELAEAAGEVWPGVRVRPGVETLVENALR
jgi:putative transposase